MIISILFFYIYYILIDYAGRFSPIMEKIIGPPLFLMFSSLFIYVLINIFCYEVNKIPKIEGEYEYELEAKPKIWHKKMGYIRIIELLTPNELLKYVYRKCGAAIGKNVILAGILSDPDLVEIGDNSTIGQDALILSHSIENGIIYIKNIKIGRNCLIGSRSLLMPGVVVEDNVIIGALTFIPKNKRLPKNTIWVGTPAREIK